MIALDARVVVRPRETARQPLAIRPYPRELEQEVETVSGRRFFLRPIRPEDEDALIGMLNRSSREDVRLRFFAPVKNFGHSFAARLTQIDYDREMAFVALEPQGAEILGVVRLIADPDNQTAEFAVMVRSDLKGVGLGHSLMLRMLDCARQRGVGRIAGEVLTENRTMLAMAEELGFAIEVPPDGSDTVTVTLDLTGSGPRPNIP